MEAYVGHSEPQAGHVLITFERQEGTRFETRSLSPRLGWLPKSRYRTGLP
jgi:hypothetical protein